VKGERGNGKGNRRKSKGEMVKRKEKGKFGREGICKREKERGKGKW
jgi:hypothetical protein